MRDLDDHPAVEANVPRKVDAPHSASAKLLLQLVATLERGPDPIHGAMVGGCVPHVPWELRPRGSCHAPGCDRRWLFYAPPVTARRASHRPLGLYRENHSHDAALDTALSRVLLGRVAGGAEPESLRVHIPGDVVAFSPIDATRPGFERAREAAREAGFGAIRRLAGGHAAVFHAQTVAFAWCVPDAEPRQRIHQRFEVMAERVTCALRRLGVDARVGEVPGEYCPGEHSVNARGATKIMGVGQRLVRGAAHVGGVIVVDGSQRIRDVLAPVYDALELEWNPEATGSVADEIGAVGVDAVAEALCDEFAREAELQSRHFSVSVVREAGELASAHRA